MISILSVIRLLAFVVAATSIVALGSDVMALALSDKGILPIDPLYAMIGLIVGGELVFLSDQFITKLQNRHIFTASF